MEPSTVAQQASPIVDRYFTSAEVDPYEALEWKTVDVEVGEHRQSDVEAPSDWGQNAINITSKLYFATVAGEREHSVRQLVHRVAKKITIEGMRHGYFDHLQFSAKTLSEEDETDDGFDTRVLRETYDFPARVFYEELSHLLLNQMAAFNTPVWLNVGVPGRKQVCSACFLLKVEDSMVDGDYSILEWIRTESKIFKGGAGSGVNLSKLRGSMEALSTGGMASGPTSYMRFADAGAGTMKSGGAHRRAAKMVIEESDHPDIRDFVWCKAREDKRMRALAEAGFEIDPFTATGEKTIAESTSFQNANISVGASDDFMARAQGGAYQPRDSRYIYPMFGLKARTTGETVEVVNARELLDEIAQAAWECGDPGMVFLDAANRMHTTPSLGPITTCNPCLVGDSLVDTSEGRIRIDRLAEMWASGEQMPYAFGFDCGKALPAMKQITKAVVTKMVTEIVEVTTEKGCVIKMTPDHLVLTRDHGRSSAGGYVAAGDLRPGQSLRKIARWVNEQRSGRHCLNHRATESVSNGTIYQSRFMWEQAYGDIPEGMDVHHLNEDPTDDRLSNFELRDIGLHQQFHSEGERNGRFIDTDIATLVEIYEIAKQLPKWSERLCRHCSQSFTPNSSRQLDCFDCSPRGLEPRVFEHDVTAPYWKRAVQNLGLEGKVSCGNFKGIRGMGWEEFGVWIAEQRTLVNDRVLSVRRIRLTEAIPVYDISVDGINNFGVATEGVEHTIVVHNCGETFLNDDSACNLASLNLVKFIGDDGKINIESCERAIDVMILAMDITCSFSELPTPAIEKNTRELRQLGLGYANLGAALMIQGMPYDSDSGRDWAAGVTALLTGRAYARSADIAKKMGAYHHYGSNTDAHQRVIATHERSLGAFPTMGSEHYAIWAAAHNEWARATRQSKHTGFRNSQVTVIAPTGTISHMMGCDTSGCEPAFSLVTHKGLAGGGSMTIEVMAVRRALENLGYGSDVDSIVAHLREHGEFPVKGLAVAPGYPVLAAEHLSIFDCANEISADGHIDMVLAISPFLSGAASKTVNLHESATPEDIRRIFIKAWDGGAKDISVYRNNSKAVQVLSNKPRPAEIPAAPETWPIIEHEEESIPIVPPDLSQDPDTTSALGREGIFVTPEQVSEALACQTPGYEKWEPIMRMWAERNEGVTARARMERTRDSITHKLDVGGHEGYITAGKYPDGNLGEIFLTGMGKEGSFLQGMMGSWSIAVSIGLQYGVPLEVYAKKFIGMEFEPRGATGIPDMPEAKSFPDYVFRWLAAKFLGADTCEELGVLTSEVKKMMTARLDAREMVPAEPHQVAGFLAMANELYGAPRSNGHMSLPIMGTKPCRSCGGIMFATGVCYTCSSCGSSSGCG